MLFAILIPYNGVAQKDTSKITISMNNWLDKSLIQPNKHILSILVSNNQYPLILQSSSAFLTQDFTRGLRKRPQVDAVYLNYQYSLKNNFFIEGGFKYLSYFTGFRANYGLISFGIAEVTSKAFNTFSFDIGLGYRILVNNKLRLFDFHSGFALGVTNNKVGSGGEEYLTGIYVDGMGNEGDSEFLMQYTIKNRVNLGFYVGLSKDIRITENLFLTARFNNHFGSNSIISEHVFNYSLSTYGIIEEVRGNLTAKGRMLALGLRWIFR